MPASAGWRRFLPSAVPNHQRYLCLRLNDGTAERGADLELGLLPTPLLPRRPEGDLATEEDDVEAGCDHVAHRFETDEDPTVTRDGLGQGAPLDLERRGEAEGKFVLPPQQVVVGVVEPLVRDHTVG